MHDEDCPCGWTPFEISESFRGIRNKNFKYEDYKRFYTLIYESQMGGTPRE